jgi:hypothetical protein
MVVIMFHSIIVNLEIIETNTAPRQYATCPRLQKDNAND